MVNPITGRQVSIFAGDGIQRTIIGGRVMDNVAPQQAPMRPSAPCQLAIRQASVESGFAVTFTFGTIAGRRPTGFNTQGLITPLTVADDSEEHHFFAKATLDPTTLQWYSTEVVEADWDVANTNTIHYTLLGIAEVIDDRLTLSTPICGNVNPDICELASEITP